MNDIIGIDFSIAIDQGASREEQRLAQRRKEIPRTLHSIHFPYAYLHRLIAPIPHRRSRRSSNVERRTPNVDATIDSERRATRRRPRRTRSGPRTPEKKKPASPQASNKPSTERAAERPGWAN
ncbi:hypothetical protein [Burkholderia sp. ABCPW 14]|uniref:hypothetical protein n=1 Tax=Burkholderia sp. ABCPW 14 TaxID=1637860 RepID=UPI0012E3706D|nr:hypothetical protein [Burkholderia sp. ABCPW 14]